MMNENVKWFVLEDWTSKELGRYETLDEVEERQQAMVEEDEGYQQAATEEEREEIENGIYEDLYVYGLDEEENVVPVQFG